MNETDPWGWLTKKDAFRTVAWIGAGVAAFVAWRLYTRSTLTPASRFPGIDHCFDHSKSADVSRLLAGFRQSYAQDWLRWQAALDEGGLGSQTTAHELGAILRRWQAVRPHAVGSTQDLRRILDRAEVHVQALGETTLRELTDPDAATRSAIGGLWDALRGGLASGEPVSEVGITKAIMLLTGGRLGPALDSTVRRALGLGRVTSADELLAVYQAIAFAIKRLESRIDCKLEALAPSWAGPIAIGRAVDMMTGPRESEATDSEAIPRIIPPRIHPPRIVAPETLRQLAARKLAGPTEIESCRSRFTAYWDAQRDEIHVSNLGNTPWLPIQALEVALMLLERHGRVLKGNAMQGRLGDEHLPLDSIEGAVASEVFGKKPGDSVFRRITPIAGLLVHLGLAGDDCRSGYLTAIRRSPRRVDPV